MRSVSYAVLCLSTLTTWAPKPGGKLADGSEQLATVTATPDKWELRRGQDLGVTMKIQAGARGAYLPNHFTAWDDTCESGFSVDIYTPGGDRASTTVAGCAADILEPGPPARERLKDYIFLKPCECRAWHTTLTHIRRSPCRYEIKAEYFAAQERIADVAALPEVHGLMVIGHLHAKSVTIRIR